jgi:hypothetical protein
MPPSPFALVNTFSLSELRMRWRCPACRSEIQHHPVDTSFPDPHDAYRCHVCHLDLRFNPVTQTMEVTPLDDEHRVESARAPRGMPPPVTASRKPSYDD